jgi:hypothetical protein
MASLHTWLFAGSLVSPLLLACGTTTVGAGVGAGGVAVGAQVQTQSTPPPADTSKVPHLADGERPEGRLCMYDHGSGQLRLCQHFAFGGCSHFGDRCEVASQERGPEPDDADWPASPP